MTATTTTESKTIVLHFSPELPCNLDHCEELTSIGQLSITHDDIQLCPQCPTHGYMWECSEQEQLASVVRYASWLFDNEGSTRVIRSAKLEEIPNYEADEEANSTDEGWLVEWSCQDRLKRVYVVWSVDGLCFEVYQ